MDAWDCCPAGAQFDFLKMTKLHGSDIATNPPYGKLAEKIIRHALALTKPAAGKVVMLLPHAWDTAKGRVDLFENPTIQVQADSAAADSLGEPGTHRVTVEQSQLVRLGLELRWDSDHGMADIKRAPTEADSLAGVIPSNSAAQSL